MIAALQPAPLDQWRRRFGGRRRQRARLRPYAALGYLTSGPVLERLVEVENLLLVVLFDEPASHGQRILRLAGYCGARVPWGVRFGGLGQNRFLKNLLLQPVPGGPGLRLDARSTELLELGLGLDCQIDCHYRWHRHRLPRQRPVQLPKLWAGFRPADAVTLTGEGPEAAAYGCRTGGSTAQFMAHSRREHFGLVLYPLSWVSHHWQQAVAVFADLGHFPKRQVFSLPEMPGGLVGFQDAVEFDLLTSRFRPGARHRKARCPAVAAG